MSGNENGERAASAGYKRKERSGWSENWHVGENLQPVAARKLQIGHCPEAGHIMMHSRRKSTGEYPTDLHSTKHKHFTKTVNIQNAKKH